MESQSNFNLQVSLVQFNYDNRIRRRLKFPMNYRTLILILSLKEKIQKKEEDFALKRRVNCYDKQYG